MILCVGTTPAVQKSLKFSSFTIDEVNRAIEVTQTAAGKSINVARVLTLMSMETLATGFLGGESGEFIRQELEREGIRQEWIAVPFRTRTCTTVLDVSAQTTTELVEESHSIEPQYWRELEELIESLLPRCKAMVLSGGLPPKGPQDFYGICAKRAQKHDVPVIVDAKGQPLREAMQYRPLMVKPNRSELASTFSLAVESDAQLKEAIKRLLAMGTRCVLVTMGAKGAVFADSSGFSFVSAPRVQTVNPIGSGDSVAAGFAAGMVQGLPPLECARLGIACGSANAMTATPGVVDPSEVETLRAGIRVGAF